MNECPNSAVAVFANNQYELNALSVEDIASQLQLNRYPDRNVKIFPCSDAGYGLQEGFEWLALSMCNTVNKQKILAIQLVRANRRKTILLVCGFIRVEDQF